MRKAILSIALTAVLLCPAFGEVQFKDVPKHNWAADHVAIVVAEGVMKGYPDGTFKGNKCVTRYELAVALERMIAYIEGSLKPEVERKGAGQPSSPQAAPSPQPSPPGDGVKVTPAAGESEAASKGNPAQALKDGLYIAADSPLLKDQTRTVTPTELAQALTSVTSRLIEKYIPPPAD